jgi:hypothetical protein
MVANLVRADQKRPDIYRPLVAIGHTKDLTDPQTVESFLGILRATGIAVSTFKMVYPKLLQEKAQTASVH